MDADLMVERPDDDSLLEEYRSVFSKLKSEPNSKSPQLTLDEKLSKWRGFPLTLVQDFLPGYDFDADETFMALIQALDPLEIECCKLMATGTKPSVPSAVMAVSPQLTYSSARDASKRMQAKPEWHKLKTYLEEILADLQPDYGGVTPEMLIDRISRMAMTAPEPKDTIQLVGFLEKLKFFEAAEPGTAAKLPKGVSQADLALMKKASGNG